MERSSSGRCATQSPAVMLVTTFAIAFLLQSVALISTSATARSASRASLASLNQPVDDRRRRRPQGDDRRGRRRRGALGAARCCSADDDRPAHARGRDGLPHRAAARRRREPVIGVAVLLSGVARGDRRRDPDRADAVRDARLRAQDTIVVLVGVVVGGIDRLWTATLGGFAIGFATGVINGALPTDKTSYLPSVVFALVILVLLVRPAGCSRAGARAVERV
jgi:branched-chain amino acid transport system permease protein